MNFVNKIRYSHSLRDELSVDRIPEEASFFHPHIQTGPWGVQPSSYAIGTGSFPGLKRSERGVDFPIHLTPRFKKE